MTVTYALIAGAAGLLLALTGVWTGLRGLKGRREDRKDYERVLSIRTRQLQSYERLLERIRSAAEIDVMDTSVPEPTDPWLRGYRACAEAVLKEINGSSESSHTR